MGDFEGKVAIVTGAGRGIGRGTALTLAKAGARLSLVGIGEESIGKVKIEIEAMGREAIAVQTDISKWADAQRMAKTVMETYGRIDLLVNNAGVHPQNEQNLRFSTFEIDDAHWDFVMNTNVKGPFNICKAVIPHMIDQQFGRIVNVSSSTGLTGKVGSAPYCASKAGIMALTKVLATEFGRHNITVNCVAPGLTMTAMNENVPPDTLKMWIGNTALGKAGQPEDIARAILCFLQEESFVTGQTLVVDGGSTMH